MRLDRKNENRLSVNPVMVSALIRKDGTITSAGEWHYTFVGKNSGLPFYDFLPLADGNLLAATIQKTLSDPGYPDMPKGEVLLELITDLDNREGNTYSGVYLCLVATDDTENGEPLARIYYSDLAGVSGTIERYTYNMAKYRYFMSMRNDIFFEYNTDTGNFTLYKYFNGNCFKIADMDLDEYISGIQERHIGDNHAYRGEMEQIVSYLKKKERNFSMNVQYSLPGGEKRSAKLMGGVVPRYDNIVAGIYSSNNRASDEPYYMTAGARDPGTGLLNKRAVTEYIIDMLPTLSDKTAWLIMIDIDDFKNVNDNFGHAFGDEVISYVADSLMSVMDARGFVGRFGGDEFMVFVYGVPTREALKNMLKALHKKIALKYDGKFRLTLSEGVSQYPVDGKEIDTLFAKADKALYIAKEKGKNRHIIYDEKLHGGIEGDHMESQAVSYAISRDKKREFITSLVLGLSQKGIEYLVRNRNLQRDIRTVFDLDGFSVIGEQGMEALLTEGKYVLEDFHPDEMVTFDFTGFTRMGGDDHTYVLNNVETIRDSNPMMYERLKKFEISACVVCVTFSGDTPRAIVSFDVFNRIRKWSQSDIDMMSILGNLAGALLMEKENR